MTSWREYKRQTTPSESAPTPHLATYLSVVGNRQNEIMKVLSIVATVFLPLGLIAGLFGMNFENMPGIGFKWGYHIVVGVSVFAAALVAWMFWLKRWVIAGAGFFRPRRLRRLVPASRRSRSVLPDSLGNTVPQLTTHGSRRDLRTATEAEMATVSLPAHQPR